MFKIEKHFHTHHHTLLRRDDPVVDLILAKLAGVATMQEAIMTDITKLQADVAALAAANATLTTAVTAVGTDLTGLRGQIATLSAQIAAGGTVQQSDIDALDASVVTAVSNLTANTSTLQGDVAVDQPAPVPAPAPAPTPAPASLTTDAPSS